MADRPAGGYSGGMVRRLELAQALVNGTLQRNFQGYSTHAACDLIGFGMSDDAYHITAPTETGEGAAASAAVEIGGSSGNGVSSASARR